MNGYVWIAALAGGMLMQPTLTAAHIQPEPTIQHVRQALTNAQATAQDVAHNTARLATLKQAQHALHNARQTALRRTQLQPRTSPFLAHEQPKSDQQTTPERSAEPHPHPSSARTLTPPFSARDPVPQPLSSGQRFLQSTAIGLSLWLGAGLLGGLAYAILQEDDTSRPDIAAALFGTIAVSTVVVGVPISIAKTAQKHDLRGNPYVATFLGLALGGGLLMLTHTLVGDLPSLIAAPFFHVLGLVSGFELTHSVTSSLNVAQSQPPKPGSGFTLTFHF